MFVADNAGLPPAGEVTITSLPVIGGEIKILPFPMPGDDGVVTIMPVEDGQMTILPFPLPTDDGVFTILPFPMPGDGVVNILPVDFDFSAVSSITLGEFNFAALDWNALLPEEFVKLAGFGFQSFTVLDGVVSLTLLDGSTFELSLGTAEPVSVEGIEGGRLMVDPATLTGALLDGFNAGWI
ncbi:MAG: hypothetical protein JHC88_10530 [Niveispirillum sp.]|nr:hypothetical protein [Niveispirillum sp.]